MNIQSALSLGWACLHESEVVSAPGVLGWTGSFPRICFQRDVGVVGCLGQRPVPAVCSQQPPEVLLHIPASPASPTPLGKASGPLLPQPQGLLVCRNPGVFFPSE